MLVGATVIECINFSVITKPQMSVVYQTVSQPRCLSVAVFCCYGSAPGAFLSLGQVEGVNYLGHVSLKTKPGRPGVLRFMGSQRVGHD